LFFGNCVIIAQLKPDESKNKLSFANLTLELWEKIYEKLFGGFEDLAATALEDENEEDELANVPKHKKTKQGYLKDGFVVDTSDGSDDSSEVYDTEDEDLYEEDDYKCEKEKDKDKDTEQDEDGFAEDIGSELSEDKYDYNSTDESSK
jgi:hypothetical protein